MYITMKHASEAFILLSYERPCKMHWMTNKQQGKEGEKKREVIETPGMYYFTKSCCEGNKNVWGR